MNLLTGRVNNEGTHFELDGGIELPLNGGYRQYAGRKMTLGIRPEHIALSSQAEGGVPMVMDTLEILGADNWRTDAGASRSWWCDWRIRSARRQAARCGCIWRKISCIF